MEKINSFVADISNFHLNMLLVLGLALFGGTIGGRLFQKIKIPQVVGYIFIGFLLGPSIVGIINSQMLQTLVPFSHFALGLIGFMIGGELNRQTLKKYGKQFAVILLFEGMFAFILVTLLIGGIGSLFLKDTKMAWSLALLLGAISSATAPAATTDVLWEYKAKGPLTTTVFGIVALDDVLAIILFAVASSLVTHLLGLSQGVSLTAFLQPIYEIGGAVFVGGISGVILIAIINHYQQKERMLVFLIGMVLFVLGFSVAINVSMLLAAMTLGIIVANGLSSMSKQVFNIIQDFSPPIFILFFVLVGARLNPQSFTPAMSVVLVLYLIGRTGGKMSGAYWGAGLCHADEAVKKYLPLCLFSQAGVAVGLSLVASQSLDKEMGNMVIVIITMTTFVVQLLGPPCVKYAVVKAREAGKNITEEDIVRTASVQELMDSRYPIIHENTPAERILDIFAKSPYTQYPVVTPQGKLSGVINIDGIKNSLLFEKADQLLLAADLKERFPHEVTLNTSLWEAKNYMDNFRLGFLPVADKEGVILGGFDRRMYKKFVSTKLLGL
ncbi:MAG TPA: cation:proton antiporter [Candidatus Omnitrophota bacterium]|nr:cation:proton antiporter [Candidatus Omnitrophota bacterium]